MTQRIIKDQYRTLFFNDKNELHRENGPAVEYIDDPEDCRIEESKQWYINGKRHRADGPAVEDVDGYKEWWINGKKINCSSQEKFEKLRDSKLNKGMSVNNNKEEEEMSNLVKSESVSKVMEVVKVEATAASWRTAARQAVKRTKDPLVNLLKSRKVPGLVLGYVEQALDTDIGDGVYALALGTVLEAMPVAKFKNNPNYSKLASEIRIYGYERVFSGVIDPALDLVIGVFNEQIDNLMT